jgi:hypothetical protein
MDRTMLARRRVLYLKKEADLDELRREIVDALDLERRASRAWNSARDEFREQVLDYNYQADRDHKNLMRRLTRR